MISMRASIRRCPFCGRYSTDAKCKKCNCSTVTAHPAKYSPDDRYGKYRRISVAEEYGENGKYQHDKV